MAKFKIIILALASIATCSPAYAQYATGYESGSPNYQPYGIEQQQMDQQLQMQRMQEMQQQQQMLQQQAQQNEMMRQQMNQQYGYGR